MKLVIQRVNKAGVTQVISNKLVGEIGRGLLVLFGVGKNDGKKDAEILADKLLKLRIMADENDKMNLSIKDVGGEILVVSQFTLYADTSAGNRPSFINAGDPKMARDLYEFFISKLKESGLKIETGSFGDYMKINVELDGPVTILY
jgi:D-aminoacyl-tRNA deacylase